MQSGIKEKDEKDKKKQDVISEDITIDKAYLNKRYPNKTVLTWVYHEKEYMSDKERDGGEIPGLCNFTE